MPVLERGRWYEDFTLKPDFAFMWDIYDPTVRAVLEYFYEQSLLFRSWCPNLGIKFAMFAAGEPRVDERFDELRACLSLVALTLPIEGLGDVDGQVFATPAIVAYIGWREDGGANNPAHYFPDFIWRRR